MGCLVGWIDGKFSGCVEGLLCGKKDGWTDGPRRGCREG